MSKPRSSLGPPFLKGIFGSILTGLDLTSAEGAERAAALQYKNDLTKLFAMGRSALSHYLASCGSGHLFVDLSAQSHPAAVAVSHAFVWLHIRRQDIC